MRLPFTSESRSRKKREEKRSFAWQIAKGIFRFFLIALVLGLVWYITRLPFFTITDVTVEGGETIPHDEVRATVLRELQGAYVFFVPKRFSYLYPEERIEESLRQNERMYNITVTRESRTQLGVRFQEYVPHALLCVYEHPDIPCYFITENGYAYTEAPLLFGGSLIRHLEEGLTEIKHGTILSPDTVRAVDAFILRLSQEQALRVSSVVYKQNGDLEFFINGGGTILISGKKDFNESFDNLTSVLTSKEFEHIEPGNFKYIDVRFDHKVFVNETLTETGSTTASTTEELPE